MTVARSRSRAGMLRVPVLCPFLVALLVGLAGCGADGPAGGSAAPDAFGVFQEGLAPSAGAAELARLTAADAAAGSFFGWNVAIDGATVVVGAPATNDGAEAAGSAYIFERRGNGWLQQAKLTDSDPGFRHVFGWSVAVNGTTVVVGAPGTFFDSVDPGAAYVFERTGNAWTLRARLAATEPAPGDNFGRSVAVSGNTVLVGAPDFEGVNSGTGAVYAFERTPGGWSRGVRLMSSDAEPGDNLGAEVAISGQTAVVSASANADFGPRTGSAYVFQRDGTGWIEQAKLLSSDAAAGDQFGSSVDISGATVVVGADLDDDAGNFSGSAYVFERTGSGWSEVAKLTASDAAAEDTYGLSVAISGSTIVVNSPSNDGRGVNSGAAYLYRRTGDGWVEQAKLTGSDTGTEDHFARWVTISGTTVVAGASSDNDSAGSVYVFRVLGAP